MCSPLSVLIRPMADFDSCLVDGRLASSIPASDRGLHYGDGLFETMAWINGRIPLFERHWMRLVAGCDRLDMTPPRRASVLSELGTVADADACKVLKLIITRGGTRRGYGFEPGVAPRRIVIAYSWPERPAAWYRTGISVRICRIRLAAQPRLAGLKTLARLEQVLARSEWQDDEFQEGLMLDHDERLVCGTMSNVFLVRGGRLVTPELSRCGVAGVMRGLICDIARDLGIPIEIRDVGADELDACEEMFVTNAISGVLPVNRLDDRALGLGRISNRLLTEANKSLSHR